MLNYSANIYDLTGLSVLRPCELISRIDGILREKDYQPKRLMGLAVFSVERDTDAAEKLAREFLSNSKGERLKDLKQTIINIATNPRNSTIHTIKEINSKKIGLLCCRINSNDEWQIDICRVREVKGVKSKTLSSTLLDLAIRQSISRKISVCFFKDNFANDEIINILYGLGFKSTVNGWVKINIENILSVCDLDRYFKKIKSSSNYVKKVINQYIDNVTNAKDNNDCNSLINIERDLRPLKFFDVEFPVYIVPIQSVWASMLFDHKLASLELFTEKPDLIMNRSNVYYRSSRPCNISAPGRILWYVKQDNKRMGTKAIRAFSYLDEVVIDTPKNIYKRYQRFGAYTWNDLNALSQHSSKKSVMALVFSDTEIFKTPVSFGDVQKILLMNRQKKNQFQSPVRISRDCFFEIYKRGKQ